MPRRRALGSIAAIGAPSRASQSSVGLDDRRLVSYTLGRSQSEKLFPSPGNKFESVTYHTQGHRTLPPGEVAGLPKGHGLLLRGTHWGLLRLTPWYRMEPWPSIAQANAPVARRTACYRAA